MIWAWLPTVLASVAVGYLLAAHLIRQAPRRRGELTRSAEYATPIMSRHR
jgi:hypothetical protein